MDMSSFIEALGHMGCGWFILKFAEDNGITVGSKTYYGGDSSMDTRIRNYNNTKNEHKEILEYLLSNWRSSYSAGLPKVSNAKLYELAKQLFCMFCKINTNGKCPNKTNISNSKIVRVSTPLIDEFPFYGFDEETIHIRYEDDIKEDERVEGLCRNLEEWYSLVIRYLNELSFELDLPNLKIEKIPVILSKARPTHSYRNNVAKWIKKQVDLRGKDITEKAIQHILDCEIQTLLVNGEFVHNYEMPYIKIYYTNTTEKDFYRYIASICMTLAHEYFHYYHYLLVGNNIYKNPMPKEDLAVTESLADIFAYDCLLRNKHFNHMMEKVAFGRHSWWIEHFGSNIPYAEAIRYCFGFGYQVQYAKMFDVLMLSKNSMKDAYKRLMRK